MIELVLAVMLPLAGGESAHIKAKIADCDRYAALNPHFAKAFAFLKRGDLASLKPGRYEIDGDNCWAMVPEVKLTPFADGVKVEAHRKYIDIQSPLTGEETIGEVAMDEKLRALPFNEEKDFVLFDAPSRPVTLKPGEFAIYFPPDGAHAPGHCEGEARTIRKLVIKVRAERPAAGEIVAATYIHYRADENRHSTAGIRFDPRQLFKKP